MMPSRLSRLSSDSVEAIIERALSTSPVDLVVSGADVGCSDDTSKARRAVWTVENLSALDEEDTPCWVSRSDSSDFGYSYVEYLPVTTFSLVCQDKRLSLVLFTTVPGGGGLCDGLNEYSKALVWVRNRIVDGHECLREAVFANAAAQERFGRPAPSHSIVTRYNEVDADFKTTLETILKTVRLQVQVWPASGTFWKAT